VSSSICNNRGIGLIESVIAILLVSIGLIALMSMQPSSWRASARADFQGRAAMMLGSELASQELLIMNPCNTVTLGEVSRTLYASGPEGTGQRGDISFSVSTTITARADIGANVWQVTVQVSWPPINATGITESTIVTRQEHFRSGCASI
jgi:Tfp pilus assembly protein PilV